MIARYICAVCPPAEVSVLLTDSCSDTETEYAAHSD